MPYGDLDFMTDEMVGGETYAHSRSLMRDVAKAAESDDSDSEERRKKLRKKYKDAPDEELQEQQGKYEQARENVKDSEKPNWSPNRNTVLEDHLDVIKAERGQRKINEAFDSVGRGIRDFAKHAWKTWPGKGKR